MTYWVIAPATRLPLPAPQLRAPSSAGTLLLSVEVLLRKLLEIPELNRLRRRAFIAGTCLADTR